MALLDKVEFRTAIEDTRARQAARIALIGANQAKAMTLLRIYMTVGLAAASVAIAAFSNPTFVPLGWALLAASVMTLFGAAFCILALRAGDVSLPGRDADFWQWAARADVTAEQVVSDYLRDLDAAMTLNRTHNDMIAISLAWAKGCAVVLPTAALTAGLIAIRLLS